MTETGKTSSELKILVLRAERPLQGFKWQLREPDRDAPCRYGEGLYASQAEAREAAKAMLMHMRAP